MSHTNSVRKDTQCSFCGEVGHNRRTCGFASLAGCLAGSEVIDLTKGTKGTCCSFCKVSGHNIRTCAGYNFKKLQAAKVIQSAWRKDRIDNFQHGAEVVATRVSHTIAPRKPRSLLETRGVESTHVESLQGSPSVSWMPGTISPVPSIQRLHQQARAISISLIEEFEECGSPLVLP